MTESPTPAFIREWLGTLRTVTFDEIAPDPAATVIFLEDVINGFFRFGPLASPRVDALTQPVLKVVRTAHEHGVRRYVLLHDAHDPATPEFESYPPHCLAGSEESQLIPEIADLPFAPEIVAIPKNSLNPALETGLDAWWDANRDLTTAIVVGDCTDLCVHQLAMHLRLRANALNLPDFDVYVPANAVDTFDIPGDAPGSAHPGDFFHDVFLYHMAQNGVRIVREITA
jgi:nicotinamidase-related amidase